MDHALLTNEDGTPKKIRLHKLKRELARKRLINFIEYTYPEYVATGFHKRYAAILDKFIAGEIKRLMIQMPPQHGKSEQCSRRMPAQILGKFPDKRLAIIAYGDSLAVKFNRDIQRIIDSPEYRELHPQTFLNGQNVVTSAKGAWLRNAREFEIVGKKGSLISTGIGGGLTGNKIDIAIVDDPYKDQESANSAAYRRKLEGWWDSVLETRLHNDSQICLTFTRWRHDDIAGYLLERQKELPESMHWEIIKFPAIKESEPTEIDPREPGEALWPERHSKEKLMAVKKTNSRVFEAMYQQNPTPMGGNVIKGEYFPRYESGAFPEGVNHCYIDTATSEKELKGNDPSGILVFRFWKNKIYLVDYVSGRWTSPELINNIKRVHKRWLTGTKSKIIIENKSNGRTTKQHLEQETLFSIFLETPIGSKLERVENQLTTLEAGRVLLPHGDTWVRKFLDSLEGFPFRKHDEEVDCLTGAMRVCFPSSGANKRKRKVRVI